ncbi:hypothetical protein BT63DRAFT_424160 [Microthyrium microscopicum]|uniref:Hydrophobin n=1 Tax=Microthyrium microscopicum TaxID=703497 RepID=A0A6A6UF78_9PEZI|nr:hypothetical protein BT63DRAFT_424160 [Microthyrium microscopicum]
MQLTQASIVAYLAFTGFAAAAAAPPRPAAPAPPQRPTVPTYNVQNIQCSSGAPFCCSPTDQNSDNLFAQTGKGTTCSAMKGSSVQCNSVVVCCNNNVAGVDNSGSQSCSANLAAPITYRT